MAQGELGLQMDSASKTAHSGARLDRLPIGRFHYRTLFLLGGGLFVDAFDVYLMAGVMGALVKSGFASMAQVGHVVSATYGGLVVGALASGYFSDKFGRKLCYQVNLAIVAIATLVTALVNTPDAMAIWRFTSGIGLGAEAVVSYATLSEFVPPSKRGRWLGLTAFIANTAIFASALGGYFLLPRHEGWRWMFGLASAAAFIIWVIRWSLKESPRWLESKGRIEEADTILREIESEYPETTVLPGYDETATVKSAKKELPATALVKKGLRVPTIIGIMLAIVQFSAIYGLLVWLPSFFVKQGLSLSTSLQYSLFMSAGGPVGTVVAALLADKIGRRKGVAVSSVVVAVLAVLYAMQSTPVAVVSVGFCLFIAVYVTATFALAGYTSELFPTAIRSRGIALCNGIGRIWSVYLPFLVVGLFAFGGLKAVVAVVACLLILQAVVVTVFGQETNQASLEELDSIADKQASA
ncbi:MFS transporter [Paraburkholderia aromaticivorans]|uniref:MFS transporter n=1 Tax=Paraburkholderia aromaticivorans TaxID=2026199 RepID=UPI001455F8C4|nr:MFS transporter [Paraburkholderia aromaticivorans]